MAIYPLGLLDSEEFTTSASLADLSSLGTSQWVGYSFAWHACLAARAQQAENAAVSLKIFSEAFCLRNSFHCNGDQSGKGYSDFTYKPFTLEGNFAAATALQEMMLQSHGNKIEVFPAIPDAWKEASFTNLRAEGAFLISAVRSEGLTQWIEIFSEAGGQCRIKDPFLGCQFMTKGIDDNFVRKTNGHITIQMKFNEKITLVMA
jgi:alpha-L-fucosidase 2